MKWEEFAATEKYRDTVKEETGKVRITHCTQHHAEGFGVCSIDDGQPTDSF